jgi:LPXTG-motif cell wall-anchored protein
VLVASTAAAFDSTARSTDRHAELVASACEEPERNRPRATNAVGGRPHRTEDHHMNRTANEPRRARRWPRLAFAGTAAALAGLVGFGGVAAAHTPSVEAGCAALEVSLAQYDGPADNNVVTVTIDGASTSTSFASGFERTFSWSGTATHTWSVVLDANRIAGEATSYDWSRSGTQDACDQAPVTTAPPGTTPADAPPATTPEATAPLTTSSTGVDVCAADDGTSTICSPAVVAPEPQAAPPTTATPPTSAARTSTTTADLRTAALPATGNATGIQLAVALSLFSAGTALVVVARRRRQASSDV